MSARVLLALAVLIGAGCGNSVGPIPVECFEGAACGAGPCTIGHIHCSGRQPSCITTDLANGTACGDGKTCIGGFCVAPPCNAGTLCTLPDSCTEGVIHCDSGQPLCTPTNKSVPDGQACGTGRVCYGGICGEACVAGMPCKTDKICRVGKSACGADGPVCDDSAVAPDGTECGPDATCQSGVCSTCKAGGSCSSPNPCMTGVITCAQGQSECTATTPIADGTSCGVGQVCGAGHCVSCRAGAACKTGCQVGEISCAQGFEECIPTGNQADGTSCGSNQVCHAGVCGPCRAGADCPLANACHAGKIACTTGEPVCVDSGNRGPGTSCDSGNGVCDGSGSCVACRSGADCSTPCHPGTISCNSGSPVCVAGPVTPDWDSCGPTAVCLRGACTEQHFLKVLSGDGQSGIVAQPTQPIVLQLTDGKGTPVAGNIIDLGVTQMTDAEGKVTFTDLVFPDDPGSFTWNAHEWAVVSGLDAQADIKVSAVAPAAGTILTLVNSSHQPGLVGANQSLRDTRARLTRPTALAASTSTLYFADGCRILALKGWTVSYVAGGDCAPSSGDGGARKDVRFADIRGLAFDATSNTLLVAEPDRVRSTDGTLSNGPFTTRIGGPNPPIPGDGDGGPGTQAVLSDVQGVAVGPDGGVYVSANGRIRRWDRTTKNIQPWFTPATPANCSGANTVVSCEHGCRVAWDAQRRPWMTANLCGGGESGTGRGLVLLDQGAFIRVLGGPEEPLSDATAISYVGANGLLLTDPSSQRVLRIDTITSVKSLLAGSGTAGDAGDLGPASEALFRNPAAALVFGGHTVIADTDNHCIRRVW